MKKEHNLAKLFVTVLRVAIGWHFLYEGLSKILVGTWTSYSFLVNTSGFLSGFYHWLASSETLLKVVDILNIYGLIIIGIALFIGLFPRISAFCGVALLALYYFAYPPFGGSLFNLNEGHLFIVDKIFIEAMALLFLSFFRDNGFSIDKVIALSGKNKKMPGPEKPDGTTHPDSRREVLKNLATLPLLGAMGWLSLQSGKKYGVDVISGATVKVNQVALGELKGVLPKGKIGEHNISRLVMGGNLIGGWAHARDLIYVNSLFKAYNSDRKIYETLILAEKAGINTINIGFGFNKFMAGYKKATGSKIKVISHVSPNMKSGDYYEEINQAIDLGTDILQVHGSWCDWLALRDHKTEVIGKMLDKIRSNGLTAGLGAHAVDSMIVCEEQGIFPDYYMQTMHHDKYWSAHPRENRLPFEVDGEKHADHNKFHDNLFCPYPEKTVDFINRSKLPVMGFKILAAGAIEPEDGFRWAFENGADFICVGMFDFQIVNDVNICMEALNKLENRQRPFFG